MTGGKFLVSAIVSTYNSEAFIRGCLEDLTSQTLFSRGDQEIIVIDSGSRQNEGKIVREYQELSPNIRCIRTEERETIYQAWNCGIRAALGKYVTSANTDDRHRPDALEIMARELDNNSEVALVYGDVFVTNFPNQTFAEHIRCGYHIRPDYAPEIMLSGCHMGPQPMWRRSLHDKIGWFNEEMKSAGDYEFWCRIATRYPMKHIPQFLGLYFENPKGICNTDTSRSSRETVRVKNLYSGQFPQPERAYDTNYQWPYPVATNHYVNICMITYNRLEFTRQSIEALVRFTRFPHVLTVVDNASSDGTREYLHGLNKLGIIKNLVLLDENAGVAKASNLAWSLEPNAACYLKLDNDIVNQKPGWLEAMVNAVEAVPELGAVAYNFEPKSYPLTFVNGYGIRKKDYGNLGGACILIPKRTEQLLGYWCEDYGLYSEEDADYGFRIRSAGLWNAYLEDEDIGLHLPGGKAAAIDLKTLSASDGMEEYQHAEYREWKDEQRRKNIGEGGPFERNISAYRSGERPLRLESAFVNKYAAKNGKATSNEKGTHDMALLIKETPLNATAKRDGQYLVTAIVSSYNAERFMRECLEDLENQTIADRLEIIVVDAASLQAEGAIVADFQKRHANITYIRTGTRIGVYAAWNIAIRMAKGKYITPFSTNDRLRANAYEIMASALERSSNAALVYGDTYHTNIPHETFDKHTRCGAFQWPDYSYRDLLNTCIIGPHPMWRKSVHESVGFFDESFTALGDQDFFIRLGARFDMQHIPQFTGLYWMSPDGISNREEIFAPELVRIRKVYAPGNGAEAAIPRPCNSDPAGTPAPSDTMKLKSTALQCKEEKRFSEAYELFRQVEACGDLAVLPDIGDCLANLGQCDEAVSFYRKALRHDAGNARAHMGIGVLDLLAGKHSDSARSFTEVLKTEPDNSRALCGLGIARYVQGLKNSGFQYFIKALDADPENITALNELTKAAYDLGRFAEAVACARNYLMYHPGDLDILFSFAGVLYKSGEYDEARDALERLLALSSDYPGGREFLAKILTEISHNFPCTESSTLQPRQSETSETFIEQGRIKKADGKYAEAFECFSKARELGELSVISDMGDCKANLGEYTDAERLYEEGIRQYPESIDALIGLGIVQLLQGKHSKAVACFNKTLKLEPSNPKALCGLGMVRNVQGKQKDALKCFSGALDAEPENLTVLHELVKCSYGLDRFDEAEKHLSSYLMYHPGDLDMQFSLAGVRYRNGNYHGALENMENLLAFTPDFAGGKELLRKIRMELKPIAGNSDLRKAVE